MKDLLSKRSMQAGIGLSLFILPASWTNATVTLLTTQGTHETVDYVDWTELGANPSTETPVSGTISSGRVYYTTNTHFGASVTFSKPTGADNTFNLLVQGTGSPSKWNGNFADGEGLFTTRGSSGATNLWMDFAAPVRGVDMKINPNGTFNPFSATIQAYDSGLSLLGSFTLTGLPYNTGGGDTAPVIGVFSGSADISRIELWTGTANGVVISQLNILSIPEPGVMVLLGVGGVLRLWQRRRSG